jgi:hypothetical protein
MKNAWRAQAVGVILSAIVVAGCSSTQPDRIETRTASLSFETKASVLLWACYESPQAYCFPVLEGSPPVQSVADRPVPWRLSLKITIIRAGTTNEVLAESLTGVVGSSVEPGDSVDDFISMTDYDPNMPPAPDRNEFGIDWTDGHLVSSGSPIYLSFIFVDPGIPNLLDTVSPDPTVPATFDFNLNTGDTVIVRARKQAEEAAPAFSPPYETVKLTATLAISGVPVAGNGPQTSSADNRSGFTFSFTVQ